MFEWFNLKTWVVCALRAGQMRSVASLSRLDLGGAYLMGADLRGADLRGADLGGAYFRGADLRGTVLDPENSPNGDVTAFAQLGELVIGYRSAGSPIIGGDGYREIGRTYTAPVFSTCHDTNCHPGLYLWPQCDMCHSDMKIITVIARAEDVHRVQTKWRCREFVRIA